MAAPKTPVTPAPAAAPTSAPVTDALGSTASHTEQHWWPKLLDDWKVADNLEVFMSVAWAIGLIATYRKAKQAATAAESAKSAAEAALSHRDKLEAVHAYTRLVDGLTRLREDIASSQWSSNLYRYEDAIELTQTIEASASPASQNEIAALGTCRQFLTTQLERLSVTTDPSKLKDKDRGAMMSGLLAQANALRDVQLHHMKKAKP